MYRRTFFAILATAALSLTSFAAHAQDKIGVLMIRQAVAD